MRLIGITGSIGSGKTTLAKIVRDLGYAVYDVDAWVRRVYHNKNFLIELENKFNGSVKNGVANKRYLRKIVFNDKKKLAELESLVYPFLDKMIKRHRLKKAKENYVVFLDIALLFEKGWNKYCDFVILADVDYEIRKQRVMERDKVSSEDFERIDNVQMSNEDKKKLADVVIDTNSSLNKLKVKMINLLNLIDGE